MWCPSAFLREFPHDRSAVGHITPRPTSVEIGLAVLRWRESVLAVFDRYAVAEAFQRALLGTTTSDSRRPFRPTVDARYVAQQTAEELPFSRYGPPPAHNCEDHITGEGWWNRDSYGRGADRRAQRHATRWQAPAATTTSAGRLALIILRDAGRERCCLFFRPCRRRPA